MGQTIHLRDSPEWFFAADIRTGRVSALLVASMLAILAAVVIPPSASDFEEPVPAASPDDTSTHDDVPLIVAQFQEIPTESIEEVQGAPVAEFTASKTSVVTNERIIFTDSSQDDGESLTHEWDFGDGTSSAETSPSHRFVTPGTFIVTLAVTDLDELSDETGQSITVAAAPLRSDFLVDGILFEAGQEISFLENVTGGTGALTLLWDFRDGNTSTADDPSHAWARVGSYSVRLTARDGAGATSVVTKVIHTYAEDSLNAFEGETTVAANFLEGVGFEVNADGGGVAYSLFLVSNPTVLPEEDIAVVSGPRLVPQYYVSAREAEGNDAAGIQNITIFYDYTDAQVAAAGLVESAFAIYYWNGATWVSTRTGVNSTGFIVGATPAEDLRVFSAGVDTVGNRVFAVVDHLSVYSVVGSVPAGGGGIVSTAPVATSATAPVTSAPITSAVPTSQAAPAPNSGPTGPGGAGSGGSGSGSNPSEPAKGSLRASLPNGSALPGLDGLAGAVIIEYVSPDGNVEPATFVLLGRDGSEHPLEADNGTGHWETSQYPNGEYTVEARRANADGSITVLASQQVVVHNAQVGVAVAAAAVIAGTALVAGASALGGAGASRIFAVFDAAREGLFAVGEDNIKERHKNRLAARRGRVLLGPVTSSILAVLLLAAFFTIEGIQGFVLADFLEKLPTVGAAALLFFGLCFGLEYAIARASGVRASYRFLASGAVALAFSSVAFRSAFGLPGYVDEAEADGKPEYSQRRMKAMRSIGFLGGIMGILIIFQSLGNQGQYGIMNVGLAIGLTTLATSALPFKPLPGSNIWLWRKSVSVAIIALSFWLYIGFLLAHVSWGMITLAAVLGLIAYGLFFAWLRLWAQPTRPLWYVQSADRLDVVLVTVRARTPQVVLTMAQRLDSGIDRAVSAVSRGIAAAVLFVVRPVARLFPKRTARSTTNGEARLPETDDATPVVDTPASTLESMDEAPKES